jgi:hypothetical protein
VHHAEARRHLIELLTRAGLTADSLEPWTAWKVFKAFARESVEDALDDCLVQYGVYEDGGGVDSAHLYFVREFSDGEDDDGGPATHLVCDLTFDVAALPTPGAEFWTQDAATFSAFVDRVEADPGFQALMNARPVASSVYVEEN